MVSKVDLMFALKEMAEDGELDRIAKAKPQSAKLVGQIKELVAGGEVSMAVLMHVLFEHEPLCASLLFYLDD